MTGRILCGFPMGDDVTCRNTAPCPVHRDRDLSPAADIPASNPAPGLFEQLTGQPLPPYVQPCTCPRGDFHNGIDPDCPQHGLSAAAIAARGPAVDYRPLLVDDAHDWSVRKRLEATLGRPALATRLADALDPHLGAELADRLDTLVTQARSEAVVELENLISEGMTQARERLSAEAAKQLREVHDERYRGHSRLS